MFRTFPAASISFFLVLGLTLPACKKYDEGPLISLTPREERIANTWVIDKAIEAGNDVTSSYDNYVLVLTTDHAATLNAQYEFFGVPINTQTNGTWAFGNDDENLILDFEDNVADGTYLILRLTEPQLWLRKIGDDLELRLKEQ
jgi:hypothetical protein